MSIQTYYVHGSKKAANAAIEAKQPVLAVCYSFVNEHTKDITELNHGDVIKFWEKKSMGSPVAKSYGNWDSKKNRVK